MRRAIGLLLLAWLVGSAAVADAPPPPAGAVVEGLQRWLDETRRLEAHFEQELLSGALGAGLTESGTLYVSRPGRMRWDYRDPEKKVALIEQGMMSLYLAEEHQMIVSEIPAEGDLLPSLLAGAERLSTLFDAEAGPLDEAPSPGRVRLRLVPRERSDSFEEVTLVLREPAFAIERATVKDAAGNCIEYRFTRIKRNGRSREDLFSFEPPPGTEIVREP